MGVHGLWRLLDPFGQVTRPEDWTDRHVAIDASIWIVQFRAKVDASEDVESKVLEGFLSRILKLLFYGIEAVFVFDGTSSSLKAAEQSKRARQREAATQVFLRKRAKQIMMAQVAAGQLKVNTLPMQMTSNEDDEGGEDDDDNIESDKVSKTTPRVKRGKQLPPSRAIVLLRKSATRKRERSTSLRDELHCTEKEERKNGEEIVAKNNKAIEGANNRENMTNIQLTNNTHKPANYYGVTIHPHIARLAPDAVSASVVKHFLADARELQAEANKGEQMISQNVLKHTSTALFMGPREVAEGNTNNTLQSAKEHNSAHVQKLHHKTHTIEDDSPITLPEENAHNQQCQEQESTTSEEEEEVKVIGNDEAMIVDIDDSQQSTDCINGTANKLEEESELFSSSSSLSSSSVVIEVADTRHNITSKTNFCERDVDNDDDDDDVKIVEVNHTSRSPSIKEYKAESSYTGITTTLAHNTHSVSPSVTSIEEIKPVSNLEILRAVSAEIDWHGNDENKNNKESTHWNENENDTKEYKNKKGISFSPSPSSQEAMHDNKDGEETNKETEHQEIDWQRQREENLWNPSTQLMQCVEVETSMSYEQPQDQKQIEQRLEPSSHWPEESELHKLEISKSEDYQEMEVISRNDLCHNKKLLVSSTITPSYLSHTAPTSQHERREIELIKQKLHEHEEEHLSPSTVAAYSEPIHDDVQRTLPNRVLPADVIDIVQLLNLCGIPYVISPSEADAQCAYLAQAHLVDAVFSEDSDVVVHGAMTVLRGFFSSSQHAVEYRHAALATIGVNKRVLVALAMLLGCDYTNGVHGIGLVGALNAITVAWPLYKTENTQCTGLCSTNTASSETEVKQNTKKQSQQQLEEEDKMRSKDADYSVYKTHHAQTHNSHSLQDDVDAVHALLTRWRLLITKPLTKWEDTEDTMSLLQFTLLKENFAQWASLKVDGNFPSRAAIEAFYFPSIDNDKTTFPRTSPKWEELRVFAGTHGLLTSPWLTQRLQSAEKEFNKRADARAAEMQNSNNMQHQRKLTEFGARTGVRSKWAYKKLPSTFATALANLRGVQEQQEQQQQQYKMSHYE